MNATDTKFRDPAEVTHVQFGGRVASVRNGIAYLVYTGRIAGTHECSPEGRPGQQYSVEVNMIGGVGTYDIQSGQMLSLTWVCEVLARVFPSASPPPAARSAAIAEWRRGDPMAAAQFKPKAPRPETKIEVVDSTPEEALKTFLLALAAQDETTLRAVALPHDDFGLLLKGPVSSPDQLALLRARLQEKPIKRLTAGDQVNMPNGESRVIKLADVREGRVVLWPEGGPLPSRLENVGGHWKVFADPFIAARK